MANTAPTVSNSSVLFDQISGDCVFVERQVAREFLAGETLHCLATRYTLSRNLLRI